MITFAFHALIPTSIYDLDLDLANSTLFFTTAVLIIVLPILLLVVRCFLRRSMLAGLLPASIRVTVTYPRPSP